VRFWVEADPMASEAKPHIYFENVVTLDQVVHQSNPREVITCVRCH